MKTLNIFATALIITLSLNAFAEVKPVEKIKSGPEKNRMVISLPEMEWGNPADVASASVEDLKSSILIEAPEMEWGNPADVASSSVEDLKSNTFLFNAPEMNWGSFEDLNLESIESLKNVPLFPAPEMVWGEPADVYSFDAGK